jgi:prepilin-type processing-associated H-X9-DG protein
VVISLRWWLGEARDRAYATNCLANAKQLTLAMQMYADDNEGRLPPAATWPGAVWPFCKNEGIYTCPLDFRQNPTHGPKRLDHMHGSFGMNRRLSLQPLQKSPAPLLLFEAEQPAGDLSDAAFRHFGGLNVGFADGHAVWLSREDFMALSLKP